MGESWSWDISATGGAEDRAGALFGGNGRGLSDDFEERFPPPSPNYCPRLPPDGVPNVIYNDGRPRQHQEFYRTEV